MIHGNVTRGMNKISCDWKTNEILFLWKGFKIDHKFPFRGQTITIMLLKI